MNAVELKTPEGNGASIWFCGQCRTVAWPTPSLGSYERAVACCVPPPPKICTLCGEEITPPDNMMRVHSACMFKKRIDIGEQWETWDGWVYMDNTPPSPYEHESWEYLGVGYRGDGFFESLLDAQDFCLEADRLTREVTGHGITYPVYVHPCQPSHFKMSAQQAIEDALSDTYEDAEDSLAGVEAFHEAVKAFNTSNQHIVTWVPLMSKYIKIEDDAT